MYSAVTPGARDKSASNSVFLYVVSQGTNSFVLIFILFAIKIKRLVLYGNLAKWYISNSERFSFI